MDYKANWWLRSVGLGSNASNMNNNGKTNNNDVTNALAVERFTST